MKLPRPAKVVVASSFTTGAITFAAALVVLLRAPVPSTNNFVVFATLTTLVAATWIWPLVMYRGTQSELINLDEGFFVVAALLLPMSEAVLVFAVAIGVAHVVRRRPLAKVLFNWGQVVMSAGLGVAVAHVLAPATARLSGAEVAAATVGAVVFSVVNNCSIATIVASLGTSWWTAVRDGGEIRARLAGACIAVGVMTSLALSAYRWSWPLAVLPLLILRQVLAGHFQARHDRERLLGLFNAALDANRSLGEGEVAGAVLESARDLLRCPDATISVAAPGPEQLGAPMLVNGEPSWLVVSGRSPTEPFDAADGVLLEALGAVGAGALTNGQHYREGRFQRERLAAITSSLGEGVCALDKAARVTFMNPAARHMLGTWLDDLDATPDYLLAPALAVMLNRETLRVDDTDFRRLDGTLLPVALDGVGDPRRRPGGRGGHRLPGHLRTPRGGDRHPRGPRPGHRGVATQVAVPGQHEPRDPHTDERGAVHVPPVARHHARRDAAGMPAGHPRLGRELDGHHQRHPRLLQDRGGEAGTGGGGLRPPGVAGQRDQLSGRARPGEGALAGARPGPLATGRGARRPGAAATGSHQPGRQRHQVHPRRARHDHRGAHVGGPGAHLRRRHRHRDRPLGAGHRARHLRPGR